MWIDKKLNEYWFDEEYALYARLVDHGVLVLNTQGAALFMLEFFCT